eukprot:gene7878-38054_t
MGGDLSTNRQKETPVDQLVENLRPEMGSRQRPGEGRMLAFPPKPDIVAGGANERMTVAGGRVRPREVAGGANERMTVAGGRRRSRE